MGGVDATAPAGRAPGDDDLAGAVARLTDLTAALAARVERSEERMEAAIRTELVGLRRGLRAASDEIAAGVNRSAADLRAELAGRNGAGDADALAAHFAELDRFLRAKLGMTCISAAS